MEKISYQLIVDKQIPLDETKKSIDPLIKEVVNKVDADGLQVKIEKLPNKKFEVSIKALFPHASCYLKKEGKRITPVVKKLKKSLLRRFRESSKRSKVRSRKFKQARAS